MALKKTITDDKGIVITYFRIADIDQNFINPESYLTVYIYGYADEGLREEEKTLADKDIQKVIYWERFNFPIDDTKGYSRADIYERLKNEVSMFSDAIDM